MTLEQNQSKRALDESLKGGFFLRKKPLGGCGFGVVQLENRYCPGDARATQ
jgi:hypothetical protein